MSQEQINRIQVINDKEIKGFFGEYRFLSNFHPRTITYNGRNYPSTENAYQAAKINNADDAILYKFMELSPNESRKFGQMIPLRPDWDQIKSAVMIELTFIKFMHNEDLKQKLIQTGYRYLEETNWWNDTYWGVCNGRGENKLGKILMSVRDLCRLSNT